MPGERAAGAGLRVEGAGLRGLGLRLVVLALALVGLPQVLVKVLVLHSRALGWAELRGQGRVLNRFQSRLAQSQLAQSQLALPLTLPVEQALGQLVRRIRWIQ